jgi:hypothetical protein
MDLYTKLLMHMNDNTFKDECGHTVTNYGTTLNTNINKFGNGSAYFNGLNGLIIPDSSDFDVSTSDFTFECWTYLLSTGHNVNCIISKSIPSSAAPVLIQNANNRWQLLISQIGGSFDISINNAPNQVTLNKWTHLSLNRNGNNIYFFIDGDLLYNPILTKNINTNTYLVSLGCWWNGGSPQGTLNGYLDEVIFIKGKALRTTNFIPPIGPYSNIKYLFYNNTTKEILNFNMSTNKYEFQGFISDIDGLSDMDKINLLTYFNNSNITDLNQIPYQYNLYDYFKINNDNFRILIKK